MSQLVPTNQIETIVGTKRHATRHYARAISHERTVYILHSQQCRDTTPDLRNCLFSQALDRGIDQADWDGVEDQAVRVTIIRSGRLVPNAPGLKVNQ